MQTNLARYQDDLDSIIERAKLIERDLVNVVKGRKGKKGEPEAGRTFQFSYQAWYSEAHEVIRQILPNRLNEFKELYQGSEKRKPIDKNTYTIRDWLLSTRSPVEMFAYFDDTGIVLARFQMQRQILESAKARFESSLFDIRQIVRADLFDSELQSARELLKNGFIRAAGAIAGVVAEKHLEEVCHNHNVAMKKKPTMSTLNDALKDQDVIDVPEWRFIQRLGDLRNLCDHNRKREPTEEEVLGLIDGVDKIMKTVF
ncbi:MAG: hypothetical protein FJ012_03600 [Chloroflexi bacterium]|nr:hypothetical protein [Chloroflexota bacterium]